MAVSACVIIAVMALTVGLCVGLGSSAEGREVSFPGGFVWQLAFDKFYILQDQPRFTIDHKANSFMLDGEPFRYVSGSFHYFRAVPEAWRSRLRTMRASGLNALDT